MKKYISTLLLTILILLSGCQKSRKIENTKIMTISDIHYLSPSLHDDGPLFRYVLENSDGKTFDYCKEILDTLIETTINENPDVLVITGDISYNGSRVSHEEMASRLKEIEDHGIDVVVLSGNHDVYSTPIYYSGEEFEYITSVTALGFKNIYDDYGYNQAYIKDEDSNSIVYKVNDTVWLLCLDANYEINCSVSKNTIKWIEDVLKKAQEEKAYVISFSHQSLLKHSSYPDFGYVINQAPEIKELYKKYGVNANFAGHVHTQHIVNEDDFYEVLTSSTSIYENHYGIIEVNNDSLVYDTKSLDVEGYAKKNNSTDENLLNYSAYSKDLFLRVNSNKATRGLEGELKEKMGLLNLYYFIGKLDDQVVLDIASNTDTSYLQRISGELNKNYNHLEIDIHN